jgi:hypothetical protein
MELGQSARHRVDLGLHPTTGTKGTAVLAVLLWAGVSRRCLAIDSFSMGGLIVYCKPSFSQVTSVEIENDRNLRMGLKDCRKRVISSLAGENCFE